MSSAMRRLLGALSVIAAILPVAPAQAQAYPARSIELIVPFAPGNAPDIVARGLAEGLGKQLGQQIIVVNKPGAGGAIGYKYLDSKKPDGYSMVHSSNSISTGFHAGMMPLTYKDFAHVARVCAEYPVLAVRANAPYANLKDLVAYARKNPGSLRVGSTSIGSHMHLTAAAFFGEQGVDVTLVPYPTRGHVTSLIGGEIDAIVTLTASVSQHTKGGPLKVLGVFASARDPVLPDVATANEQGFKFQSDLWRGIAMPKDTPPAVVARMEEALGRVVNSPEFRQIGEKAGFQPTFLPSEAFTKSVASEDVVIARVMTKAGLTQPSQK
ncbi:MAG: Bug family tripartite tricarboxylate transporter substrate binding protein [Burkholderiales bacterium]